MEKYKRNLWYTLQHKYFVLIECWKEGLYWQGCIHDMSKFSPSEFCAYASHFFGEKTDLTQKAFQYAWLHHQHHNKHHWNHWVVNQVKKEAVPMPERYIIEMICDWKAMARKFGDTAQEYFQNNHHNMILHEDTLKRVQNILCVEV